jgi:PQQ-like domain
VRHVLGTQRALHPRRWFAVGAASFGSLVALVAAAAPAAASGKTVILQATYHNGITRAGLVSGSSITSANVAGLALNWTYTAGNVISGQPAVVGGVAYWGDWDGDEHATSSSGVNLWSTSLGTTTDASCQPATAGIASSPTVGTINGVETVWTGTGDAGVAALNASDGSVRWKTSIVPSGTSATGYFEWSSPALYAGSIYIGVSSFGDCPLVRGEVVKLNAVTGAIQKVAYTAPSGCVGSGVWSSPAIDTTQGAVYVTTGNANCTTSLQNAILKLSATTLAVEQSWQIPPAQWTVDSDWGSSPTLFVTKAGGTQQMMVGSADKNGTFYALNRNNLTAGPVWTLALARGGDCPQCGDGSISPAAYDGTHLYVAGGSTTINGVSCRGSVDALNPATGAVLWSDCLQQGHVLGAVTMVPGVLFVPAGAALLAINASNGTQLWSYSEPGSAIFYGPSTIAGSDLWIGNTDGSLRSFALPA